MATTSDTTNIKSFTIKAQGHKVAEDLTTQVTNKDHAPMIRNTPDKTWNEIGLDPKDFNKCQV